MKYRSIGLPLPTWLRKDYLRALSVVDGTLGRETRLFQIFFAGWTAFAYRMVTATDDAKRLQRLRPHGTSQRVNVRFTRILNAYLFNSCSAVDCLAFACYALGAWRSRNDPTAFPTETAKQLRAVTPTEVAARYEKHWPTEALTAGLLALKRNAEVDFLFTVRDVVTHRGLILNVQVLAENRTVIPRNPKDPPDLWIGAPEVEVSASTVGTLQARLIDHFKAFPVGVRSFVE